jgi:hypothetical protein
MGVADCIYPIYPPKTSGDMSANCGIPNAFGTWTGESGKNGFVDLCERVRKGPKSKVGAAFGSVGVFSYPLLPKSWLGDFPYVPGGSTAFQSGKSRGSWPWILLGVLVALLVLGGGYYYLMRKKRKKY